MIRSISDKVVQKIDDTATKLELRPILIVKFLRLISSKTKYTSRDLVRKLGLPQTHLYRLIREFTDLLESKTNFILPKKELFAELNHLIKEISTKNHHYNIDEIRKKIDQYQNIRPAPNRDLDQFTATTNTTIKRILKLAKNGDLVEKEIAFLGDDDLVSVAAALTHQCKRITVFEIDDRLIKLINQIALENNLEIEIVKQDLCQSIDQKYFSKFDLVFTDPPYVKAGINIFLNQAVKLIKKNFLGRIYLCYGNSDRARERELEIQQLILDHNLIINSKYYQFNSYYGAESIGSRSSLYVLDWTPSTKCLKLNSQKIYTND